MNILLINWSLGINSASDISFFNMELVPYFEIILICSMQRYFEIRGRKIEDTVSIDELDGAIDDREKHTYL